MMAPVVVHNEFKASSGQLFTMRLATPDDRSIVIHNINAICEEGVYLPADTFVSTLDWEAALNGESRLGRANILVVVETEGNIVGHGRLFQSGFGHKDAHVADIGLALLMPYRGIGIGGCLVDLLTDWARGVGYEKLTADFMSINYQARSLFLRRGFEVEGERLRQFQIGSSYYNQVLVGKFLWQT